MKSRMKMLMTTSLAALIGSGCAHMSSDVETFDATGKPLARTHTSAFTFFDANDNISKLSTHTAGTNGAGTYVSGLGETSSSSNLLQALGVLAPLLK